MLLTWIAAANAATYSVGPSGDYSTIADAIGTNSSEVPLVIELQAGYAPSDEPNGGGLELPLDITIQSDDGTQRIAPPLRVVQGAEVQLFDLSFGDVPVTVFNPIDGNADTAGPFCALEIVGLSTVSGEGLRISPELFSPEQGGVCVQDSELTLSQSSVSVNHKGEPYTWAERAWAITYQESAKGYMGGITLEDVELSVGSEGRGGGVYIHGAVNLQLLKISDSRFSGFAETGQLGSAVRADGLVDTQVTNTDFNNIQDTAVYLDGPSHTWTGVQMISVEGRFGAAYYLKNTGITLSGGAYTDCVATTGSLIFADIRSTAGVQSVVIDQIRMEGGSGAPVAASGANIDIRRSRFCKLNASVEAYFQTGASLSMVNTVFRNPLGQAAMAQADSKLELINNTVLGTWTLAGPTAGNTSQRIVFTNNAVVGGAGVIQGPFDDLEMDYNLFDDLGPSGLGDGVLGPNSLEMDALFWSGFVDSDCSTDPFPAPGSPLLDAGDPALRDGPFGASRSDIGAFGGPGREPWEDQVDGVDLPDTGDSGDSGDTAETGDTSPVDSGPGVQDPDPRRPLLLSGGCGAGASLAGLVLLLPLLGRRRKRGAQSPKS